ncbi:uncharacterized protein [Procambarus clarkii]|uniref:uncharacterized protein isoform X2 n=1 Tax=Procambarus clarkii TaxID=6728 RepID=UPI0037428A01
MSSSEWNESLDNIDYFISCMGSLEREDVIYLEEYLVGDESPGSQSPSCWPLVKERDEISLSKSKVDEATDRDRGELGRQMEKDILENPDDPEAIVDAESSGYCLLRTSAHTRLTRGVTKPKFVTYQSFPATKGKPFMCELCGLRLATRESRRRHILAKHIKERNNVCNVCGKTFIFKFALRTHKAVHSDTPNFICVCGMSFTLRASYMDHIKRRHRAASEIKYQCELCLKSLGDRHTLRHHLLSVHKPKTIPCTHNGCGKVFSTIALMRSHYRYHLKQRFTCDECGQGFSTESYMYKHRLTHSGFRPYVCVDCGKTYLSMSHLNKHRRSAHSSNRPFQCSFCGKCYKTKDQLTFHESSHKGEKPFECNICGYATAYRNTLYTHKKKHQLRSSTNEAESACHQQSSISSSRTSNNKLCRKMKDKEKGVKDSPSGSKSKHKIDNDEKKLNENASSEVARHNVKSISNLPSLNIVCVMPAKSDGLELQHELPMLDKASFNNVIIQSNTASGETQLPTVCDASGFSHETIVQSQGKINSSQNNLIQIGKFDSVKLLSDKNITSENASITDKQDPCIIVSSNGRCAIPTCESGDDSLLLFKVGDNSYVGICSHHTFSDGSSELHKDGESSKQLEMLDFNVQCLESMSFQTEYDSKNINSNTIPSETTDVSLSGDDISIHYMGTLQAQKRVELVVLPSTNENTAMDNDLIIQQIPNLISTTASLPSVENANSSTGKVCSAEFSTIMELDSEAPSLSGHIVDDSFSLAQLEVLCPLCDEQFLCMDDYVTHLECCHN